MLKTTLVKNTLPNRDEYIRTHILNPQPSITLIFTIESKNESILSILEDHILETASGIEWFHQDSDTDFTFLTESYNRFVKNLKESDREHVSVALALLKGKNLTLSVIGKASVYLMEDDDLTLISSPQKNSFEFSTLTNGEISRGMTIYVANIDVGKLLGVELLGEFSDLEENVFSEVAESIFAREIEESIHLTRITHTKIQNDHLQKRGSKQIDILRNNSRAVAAYIKSHKIWGQIGEKTRNFTIQDNPYKKFAFLAIGIVLLACLIYFIFRGIGAYQDLGYDDARERVKNAEKLIEESQKLSGNPEAFEKNISEAQQILFSLRKEQKYLTDSQKLQDRIEALKKEVYDIQSVDLAKKDSIIPTFGTETDPLLIGETNNKLFIIGKKGVITDYIHGNPLPSLISYPQEDEAVTAALGENGNIYILTNTQRILTPIKNNVSYVNVIGQPGWDAGSHLHIFNGNIYILAANGKQIYKYKPGVNGFSQKSDVLPNPPNETILDMAIDGGFYLLTDEGKVMRYVSTNKEDFISLPLNQVRSGWNINSEEKSEIIANSSLSYIYIRNGKKIWIFEPNSKRFQDINALTYVSQLDIQTDVEIRSISIPRDGTIYVTTQNGAYDVKFEIISGKLVLK